MIHYTEIKVRGYHLDFYGHVNNGRYMEFLEEARWAVFDKNKADLGEWKKRGFALFVVNININYRRPASLGEILEIRTFLSHIGNKSGVVHQDILLKGTETIVSDADITFVVVDINTGKALPIDGEACTMVKSVFE